MLGAGTIINPILKIVTTVVILAAVYFFIVKPTLDTTNGVFDKIPDADNLSSGLQNTINDALDSTSDQDRLRACLNRAIDAGGNEAAINRCVERFG